ncbi:MAG: Spy/CpxP family protein refolding chaperone [Massilia sp.]
MKTSAKKSLLALSLMTLVGASFAAQTETANQGRQAYAASQQAHQANQAARQAKMAEFFAARTAKLHDTLQLTAAQEPAWTAFVASIKPPAAQNRPDFGAFKGLTLPEREAKQIELEKQRIAAREARLPALNGLYAVLSPEQKLVLEKAQRHMAGAMHARMGHRWQGGHGGPGHHGDRGAPTKQG